MSLYPGGHAVLVAVALATHAFVGYTLGTVLFGRPAAGLVGGVLADVDLLVPAAWGDPFVHRGITHTPLAAALVVAAVARYDRRVAGAVGAGYASQLLLDATTAQGIPLLSPLSSAHFGVDLGGHSPAATALLWAGCLALLIAGRVRSGYSTPGS